MRCAFTNGNPYTCFWKAALIPEDGFEIVKEHYFAIASCGYKVANNTKYLLAISFWVLIC